MRRCIVSFFIRGSLQLSSRICSFPIPSSSFAACRRPGSNVVGWELAVEMLHWIHTEKWFTKSNRSLFKSPKGEEKAQSFRGILLFTLSLNSVLHAATRGCYVLLLMVFWHDTHMPYWGTFPNSADHLLSYSHKPTISSIHYLTPLNDRVTRISFKFISIASSVGAALMVVAPRVLVAATRTQ